MIHDSSTSGATLAGGPPSEDMAPATSQGLSFARALTFTIICTIAVIGGSYGVARSSVSTGTKGSLSILTLLALFGLGYFVFQVVLALVATTGERRWSEREISERRTGERARK